MYTKGDGNVGGIGTRPQHIPNGIIHESFWGIVHVHGTISYIGTVPQADNANLCTPAVSHKWPEMRCSWDVLARAHSKTTNQFQQCPNGSGGGRIVAAHSVVLFYNVFGPYIHQQMQRVWEWGDGRGSTV